MKQIFTITSVFLAILSIGANAQPVISNGNNVLPVGYSDSISVVTSAVSPGTGGANMTWDFSALTPVTAGLATIVTPASTPYAATYPGATNCIKIDVIAMGTIYEYDILSAGKWEMLANNVTAASGENYTPNPKTMMPFPFHFNDVVVDTFQKTTGSPNTVTMTYDGYGTLITPTATYTNVVRMKRDFGGSDYFFDWYSTSPHLAIVTSYDNNTGKYTFIGTGPTSVGKAVAAKTQLTVYPNPFSTTTTITVNTKEDMSTARLLVTDITGRVVKTLAADKSQIILDRTGMTAGLYFYSINNNNGCLANGRLVVE